MNRTRTKHIFQGLNISRTSWLMLIIFGFGALITSRLFYLQIIKHEEYQARADKDHFGKSVLPARRGEIFIKDYASGELVRVATNTTLDLLFADPTLIPNKKIVADRISPLIFDVNESRKQDDQRIQDETAKAKTEEDKAKIKPLNDEELFTKFSEDIYSKLSQESRASIILSNNMPKEQMNEIAALKLPGIEVTEKEVIAYPAQIGDRKEIAAALSPIVETPPSALEQILQGKNRYVILKRKLSPEISAEIKKIIAEDKTKSFAGLGLQEEYYRYYPEETLASNVLGFVTPEGLGQYGIESRFNTQLQGKKGLFETKKDSLGRQITVGDSVIQPAVDGDDIVLTIDRAVQLEIEKMLARAVKAYNGDNGQVVVMEPKTGKIIAMASYPTFNPNSFGEVFEKEIVNFSEEDIKKLVPIDEAQTNFWFYRNEETYDRIQIFKETLSDGTVVYKKFKNTFGAEAYQNKNVLQPYEPGSVFKIITMASAIDDGDVKPTNTYADSGVLYLDKNKNGKHEGPDGIRYDARIKNVSAKCTGTVNMTLIIQNSCNTGISYVARKMGKSIFYSYLLKFGFNERTEIEFDNENAGKLDHFDNWTDSEFANHAFGQGLTATPIQMITAYAALANKGVMMQPYIVESVNQKDGKVNTTQPKPLKRVVTEQTANTITAMLTNNVENGDSYGKIKLSDWYLGAKTGTAQTYRNGEALSGRGTTITNVLGYGPINDPKFVILAKIDRPRTIEWADSTAGILFHDVADFLYKHYSIPPDKGKK